MSDWLAKSKRFILKKWIGLSIIGWLIGLLFGFWLEELHQTHEVAIYNFSPFLHDFLSMAAWIPLGALIGFMQSRQLRHWKINIFSWVFASAFGWWIPATISSLYLENGFYWVAPLFPILSILIIGISTGIFQTQALGKSFSRPKLLIASNVLGIFALAIFMVWVFPIDSGTSLFDTIFYALYNSLGFQKLFFYRDFMAIVSWITLPFIGTLTMSLPIGILLLNGNIESSKEQTSEKLIEMSTTG